jgi:glycerol-1-phosphatase
MTWLAGRYAGVVLDVDGVVVLDHAALPGAAETVAALRRAGVGLQLATNNAARTPEQIAASLDAVGSRWIRPRSSRQRSSPPIWWSPVPAAW